MTEAIQADAAKALRRLASGLTTLADQIDAGQAEYLDGSFAFDLDADGAQVPFGSVKAWAKPATGIAHLQANIRYRFSFQGWQP